MEFLINSTELLESLIESGRIVDIKNENFVYDNELEYYVLQDIIYRWNLEVEKQFSNSTRELLRRLSSYLSKAIATFLNRTNSQLYLELSIFFGLCCSSSCFIFNAITGTSSYPIPA